MQCVASCQGLALRKLLASCTVPPLSAVCSFLRGLKPGLQPCFNHISGVHQGLKEGNFLRQVTCHWCSKNWPRPLQRSYHLKPHCSKHLSPSASKCIWPLDPSEFVELQRRAHDQCHLPKGCSLLLSSARRDQLHPL